MATLDVSRQILITVDELLAGAEIECPKCHTVLPVRMTDKTLLCPRCRDVADRAVVIPYFTDIIGKLQSLQTNGDQLKFRLPIEEPKANPQPTQAA